MVYLELVKIFPSRKLAKSLGFYRVSNRNGARRRGVDGAIRIKKLSCLGRGLKDGQRMGRGWNGRCRKEPQVSWAFSTRLSSSIHSFGLWRPSPRGPKVSRLGSPMAWSLFPSLAPPDCFQLRLRPRSAAAFSTLVWICWVAWSWIFAGAWIPPWISTR